VQVVKIPILCLALAAALAAPASSQTSYFKGRSITIFVGTGGNLTSGAAGAYSPSDSAVDYVGNRSYAAPAATPGLRPITVPAGTWYVTEFAGYSNKAGGETSTGESSTWAVFEGGDTSLGNTGTFTHPTATNAIQGWRHAGLNIGPLVGGDTFEMRVTHPAWATNPTVVAYSAVLTLEQR
jgi:hypothetical protein